MSGLSTHVLDAAKGKPARGVAVTLRRGNGEVIATGITDSDGRIADLHPGPTQAGTYRLVFDTEGYFASTGTEAFYPEVVITFALADPGSHYHVPLLLSPFAYSTYRGS